MTFCRTTLRLLKKRHKKTSLAEESQSGEVTHVVLSTHTQLRHHFPNPFGLGAYAPSATISPNPDLLLLLFAFPGAAWPRPTTQHVPHIINPKP